jgi:hypothetical protein
MEKIRAMTLLYGSLSADMKAQTKPCILADVTD